MEVAHLSNRIGIPTLPNQKPIQESTSYTLQFLRYDPDNKVY